ncbi:hypothetical protein [Mesorhizobium sp. J428]|uniref:hypothetical protein n=1 Tax=Mesorhizobium sp. J428 TaxID=2898440 RepID=UPI002151CBCC|nr:hypothetical protein [Mesorhizobium sp. J428]MCR5856135.1 hypothetical protein [Mesorhizobium sp. J428]
MSISEAPATVVVSETGPADGTSYVDWPAILAGVVLASALSLVLLTFGSAIGLSMTSAREGQSASLFWIAVVGGLWILWVQVIASFAGGYLTGRMRRRIGDASEYESDVRDGSNGLVTWALGTLVAGAIAYSGLMGAANVAGQTAGAVASAAGNTAAAVADSVDSSDLLIDRTLRGRPDAAPLSDADRAAVGRILVSAATGDTIDPADRDYLASVVAARAGISPEEAGQRIDQAVAQAREIEAQARETAEQARRASLVAAFLAAASLLVGAAVSYGAATMGGNHRDKQTVVEGWYRPW